MNVSKTNAEEVKCTYCLKLPENCLCHDAKKCHVKNKIKVVILQHPQEPKEPLSTACLLGQALTDCTLKVGLSWPNAKKAMDLETVEPRRWAVAYLGSGIKFAEGVDKKTQLTNFLQQGVVLVDKKGKALSASLQKIAMMDIQGIIFLDGTWPQVKTLWWRNAWLSKLQRFILFPEKNSVYGKLRKEPKKECLSTLESVCFTLKKFGQSEQSLVPVEELFTKMLKNFEAQKLAKKN